MIRSGDSSGGCDNIKIVVNSALPYANGSLHLGHISGAYLSADIFTRFNRMIGNEVLFISGSDEYGTPITISAEKQNTTPEKIAEKFHNEFIHTFRSMDIDFNLFTRTSYREHWKMVQEIFLDLLDKGFLHEKAMISPYCAKCGRFMPDRYIEGTCPHCGFKQARGDQCDECGRTLDPQELIEPRCVLCDETPEFRETSHFFLRLDLFQEKLISWLETKDYWRTNVLAFTRNFISSGLRERPITRDLDWGVPIPLEGYEHKRIYVWFEALIGYLSGPKVYSDKIGKPDYWKSFYYDREVKTYYFLGKDNIPFHTVIWPALLMGMGDINLPYDVPANEYLRFKGEQFSKSRGIGLTVDEALKLVPKDYLRFYMSMNLPETGDSDFTLSDLQDKVNSELIDKFGNFIHRVVSFIHKNGLNPSEGILDESDLMALDEAERSFERYSSSISKVQIKRAFQEWLELVKYSNVYFNDAAPWKIIKTDREKCATKLYTALRLSEYLAYMLYPYCPSSARSVMGIINPSGFVEFRSENLKANNHSYSPILSEVPFQKIDLEVKNGNSLDLRVALIENARIHQDSDRLLVLGLSLGNEKRQIVAGLRKYYDVSELMGKKIVLVANMKRAKIRGEESNGMLLAADDGITISLLKPPEDSQPGDEVNLGELPYNSSGTITVDDLREFNLRVIENDGKKYVSAVVSGKNLIMNLQGKNVEIYSEVAVNATVR